MPRQKSTHIDAPEAVGERVRKAREEAGLTQLQLSFEGCTTAYISRIEAGQRTPSLQLLRELGRRLGVSEDYLATGVRPDEVRDRLMEAELALRLDEIPRAEELFAQAAASSNGPERGRGLLGLGRIAYRAGQLERTIELLEEARGLLDTDAAELASLVDTLGRAYAAANQLETAIGLFESALATAQERGDEIEAFRFSILLANALVDSGGFGRSEELLGAALARARDARDPILLARLYWSQSRLHTVQNRQDLAARYAEKALTVLELTEHTYYAARAHHLLAYVELERSRPERALDLLAAGLPLIVDAGNRYEEALFGLERARALAALGHRQEAAELAHSVSGALLETSKVDAGRCYALVAQLASEEGDDDRALELYELAVETLEGFPSPYLLEAYGRLAELLEARGRADEALGVLKKALRVQVEAGRPLGRTTAPAAAR